ncbi:MCE family protein [Actinomadura sp. DC4]|uniref:MCE family protein n=1 Tax=Actinomadura sp. DC4 TaxID=3055069 RepID=UPI0025B1F6C4|nr:MCE family protein [Actinomadura sp. DC4]MDN3351308.1 MCE family protein [Actinomadura sp. DC4]
MSHRPGRPARRAAVAVTVLALAASTGGCSVVGGSPGTYRMTAYFARTPSLYEKSKVTVMGANAGTITSIRTVGSRVRVDLAVNRDVPVPADAHAAIAAVDTLGERTVVLYPPWRPGMARAAPGAVIPQNRTELPAEIDQALAAFTKLDEAIDPARLHQLIKSGADSLDGRGDDINQALRSTASLTGDLAGQDQRIVRVAKGLRDLAAGLNRKDRDLGGTIDDVAAATGTLAGERTELKNFIAGMVAMIRKSGALLVSYQETLPGAVAGLSNIVLSLKAGSGSVNQVIGALSRFTDVAVQAWDRKNHVAVIRLVLDATVRVWLQPLFTALGWGRVPCLSGDPNIANCPKGAK